MIYVIGIGPGSKEMMTLEAINAIENSEVIVGYKTYINLIHEFIKDKEVVQNGMRQEIDRCTEAVKIAKTGKNVAVISSGDAGIYGMAGLVLELVSKEEQKVEVKIVPGVTASIGAAAILGAPIMHDFCHISLSDLLTPWEVIEKRLKLMKQLSGKYLIRQTKVHATKEEQDFICVYLTNFKDVKMFSTLVLFSSYYKCI